MSSTTCDQVAERIALGEPLGDAGEHATTCERCKRLVALPVELGVVRREADPGLGFTARMTAGAQQRIVVRRRRRVAAGLAAAVAVTTLGFFALTREPQQQQVVTNPPVEVPGPAMDRDNTPSQDDESEEPAADEELRALVRLANTDRALKRAADWRRIEEPVAPYGALLRKVSHE